MASSKAFLVLGLVLAVVLVISYEVSARELVETAQTRMHSLNNSSGEIRRACINEETVKPNTAEAANGEQLDGHGYGHGHGHGHGGKPGHGGHPGHGALGEELNTAEAANGEQLDGHGYGHGHGHGHGHGGKPGHGGHPGHGAVGEELQVEN